MAHTGIADRVDQQQSNAAEFFALMVELLDRLSQIDDRRKIAQTACMLEDIWSNVCQQLGINEHQIRSSKHRRSWEQVLHMPTRTATRADRLTEVSRQPAKYAPSVGASEVERTFGTAAQTLLDHS